MTKVQRELQEICEANGGLLRAEDIVAFARNKKTALHKKFEWEDTKAAHQYRLEQARRIIRVEVIMPEGATAPIRSFVSFVDQRKEAGGGYTPMVRVLTERELYDQMLAEAMDELECFRRKYRKLEALAPVMEAIGKLKPKRRKRRRRTG